MKKILTIILSMLIAIVPLASCGTTEKPAAATLELSQEYISLSLFGEKELVASVSDDSQVDWENSNSSVIKIVEMNNAVKLIAKSVGTAVITAKSGKLSSSCVVSVAPTNEKLALSVVGRDTLDLRVGGDVYIPTSVSFGGNEFTKASIKFTSENTEIAEVSADGHVTAKAAGTTNIAVVAEFEGNYSNVVNVSVNVSNGPYLKVNAAFLSLYATKEALDPLEFPSNKEFKVSIVDGANEVEVSDYTIEYTTEGIAKLENGVLNAVKKGTTQVKVICTYQGVEYYANIYVEVKDLPKVKISLEKDAVTLVVKSEVEFFNTKTQLSVSATLDGKNIAKSDIYWTVDDGTNVATVTSAGIVKAVSVGTATVSANYDFAGKTYKDSCTVNVTNVLLDGAITKVDAGNSLVFEGVDYTNSSTDPLIRFQYIPPVEYVGDKGTGAGGTAADAAPYGPEMIYVTVQDAENLGNYVTVAVRRYHNDGAFYKSSRVGARASTWGAYMTGQANRTADFYGYFAGPSDPTSWGCPMGGNGGYGAGAAFSFYGAFLYETENVDNYKMGISVDGSKVYMYNGGTITLLWDFSAAGQNGVNKPTWDGIKSNKVNIFVTIDYIQHGYGSAYFAIDKLAGATITADSTLSVESVESAGVVIPAAYKA